MNKILNWYKQNLAQILLLSIVATVFVLAVKVIPYVSFLFPDELGFILVFIAWYLLFWPSTKLLVYLSWVVILVAFLTSSLQLGGVAGYLGDFLYFLLFLIFVSLIKDIAKNRNGNVE